MSETKKSSLGRQVIIAFLVVVVLAGTSPWWRPKLRALLHNAPAPVQNALSDDDHKELDRLIQEGHTVARDDTPKCQAFLHEAAAFLKKAGEDAWKDTEEKAKQVDKDALGNSVNDVTAHLESISKSR